MRNVKKSPVVILFIVAAVLYVIIYILPQVTGALRSSYTAEYGELKISDKAEGYIVRTEYVYFSNVNGVANRYIKENKLVRRGTRIMEVTQGNTESAGSAEASGNGAEADTDKKSGKSGGGDKSAGASEAADKKTETADTAGKENGSGPDNKALDPSHKGSSTYEEVRKNVKGSHRIETDDFVTLQEGILSFHADGNESLITPENMGDKDKSFYKKLHNFSDQDLKSDIIAKTDPVFKICDRSAWYIVCYIPREHEDRYAEGSRVRVLINDEKTITGTVQSITDERREKRLTIRTNNWYDKFASLRQADVEVIASDVMGLMISNTSIVYKNKAPGVYVRQKTGKYRYVPINVIATDGTYSVISPSQYRDADGNTVQTVRSYDDILRRPDRPS